MCTAVLNKSNLLKKEVFQNMFDNNPDGIGVGFFEKSRARVYKSLTGVDEVYEVYKKFRQSHSSPVIIHARIGTAGKVDKKNIHPLRVNKSILFAHNGIVDIDQVDKTKSDTWHVARAVAKFARPEKVMIKGSHEYNLIDAVCGSLSKFVFLNSQGKFCIMNSQAGHWDSHGNWYSNHNYKPSQWYDYGGKRVYKKSQDKVNPYSSYNTKKYDESEDVWYKAYKTYDNLVLECAYAIGVSSYSHSYDDPVSIESQLMESYDFIDLVDLADKIIEGKISRAGDQSLHWLKVAQNEYRDAYKSAYGLYPENDRVVQQGQGRSRVPF